MFNVGLLLASVAVGTFSLYLHNDLLPWIYLIFACAATAVARQPDNQIVGILWFILFVFPALFLVYYMDWIWLLVYVVLVGSRYLHLRTLKKGVNENG